MPRKYKLNWDNANKIWFKYYIDPETNKRKKKYCGRAQSRTNDYPAYQSALQVWEEFTGTISLALPTKRHAKATTNKPKFPIDSIAYAEYVFLDRHMEERWRKGDTVTSTISIYKFSLRHLQLFLSEEEYLLGSGSGKAHGINAVITEDKLKRLAKYFDNRVGKLTKDPSTHLSYGTARSYFSRIKHFIEWCYTTHKKLNHLPRNIRSLSLANPKRNRNRDDEVYQVGPEIFTHNEIEKLFRATVTMNSNHPSILYLLLGLNTGMTGIDIGTLKMNNILHDPDTNRPVRIFKSRRKTGVRGEWRLWPITSSLLHEFLKIRAKSVEFDSALMDYPYVFGRMSQHLKPMLQPYPIRFTDHVDATEGHSYSRTLQQVYHSLKKEAGVTLDYRHLRKTAAEAMKAVTEQNITLTQTFLCHTPRTLAETAYTLIPYDLMNSYMPQVYSHLELDKLSEVINMSWENWKKRFEWLMNT